MPRITPFLWFDHQAEEAARFYASIFDDSRIGKITRYGAAGPGPEGTVMTVEFELQGQRFIALNGGPQYKFTEAISLSIECETQEEVDEIWEKLTDGGEEGPCGWLKDRYGLSWQVTPKGISELFDNRDSARSKRAMEAMFKMKKLDIAGLRAAYQGR